MPIDDFFEYLSYCGGRDTLVFDSAKDASLARDVLIEQFESDGVSIEQRPELNQFGNELQIKLRKVQHEPVAQAQAQAVR
jgi:hypothetical protein